jgi:hypothetical protein
MATEVPGRRDSENKNRFDILVPLFVMHSDADGVDLKKSDRKDMFR